MSLWKEAVGVFYIRSWLSKSCTRQNFVKFAWSQGIVSPGSTCYAELSLWVVTWGVPVWKMPKRSSIFWSGNEHELSLSLSLTHTHTHTHHPPYRPPLLTGTLDWICDRTELMYTRPCWTVNESICWSPWEDVAYIFTSIRPKENVIFC